MHAFYTQFYMMGYKNGPSVQLLWMSNLSSSSSLPFGCFYCPLAKLDTSTLGSVETDLLLEPLAVNSKFHHFLDYVRLADQIWPRSTRGINSGWPTTGAPVTPQLSRLAAARSTWPLPTQSCFLPVRNYSCFFFFLEQWQRQSELPLYNFVFMSFVF